MGFNYKTRDIVSVYSYKQNDELKIIEFPTMTEEWFDFIVDCRRGIVHD